MKIFNKLKGDNGERIAQKFLKRKGYKILATNEKNIGEIDIIARIKKVIVFVEVKYRSTDDFGQPREAVNKAKQAKIRRAALVYLSSHKLTGSEVRFDVIEILGDQISHLEGCF